MTGYFNPLSYENLDTSIARAPDDQPVIPLLDLEKFDGAGIYALYYTGEHPAYRLLAGRNRITPSSWVIYVGKAGTENARKGGPAQVYSTVGSKLYAKIQNRRKSIGLAKSLGVEGSQARVLMVAPTWVPLAEVVAIQIHSPVWNVIADGLGNHNPGAGRYQGMRPRWDTLHPMREWAERLQPRSESVSDIQQNVLEYLATHEK